MGRPVRCPRDRTLVVITRGGWPVAAPARWWMEGVCSACLGTVTMTRRGVGVRGGQKGELIRVPRGTLKSDLESRSGPRYAEVVKGRRTR